MVFRLILIKKSVYNQSYREREFFRLKPSNVEIILNSMYIIHKQPQSKMRKSKYATSNFFSSFYFTIKVYFLPFVLSNLDMSNLSSDIISTIKQLVNDTLLSLVACNAKSKVVN